MATYGTPQPNTYVWVFSLHPLHSPTAPPHAPTHVGAIPTSIYYLYCYMRDYAHSKKGRYVKYKKSAKERKIVFNLTFAQFVALTTQRCHYCGRFNKNRTYTGIDRLNNKKGYIRSNCCSCCSKCNYMKRGMSVVEFRSAVKRVYKHWAVNCATLI